MVYEPVLTLLFSSQFQSTVFTWWRLGIISKAIPSLRPATFDECSSH